MTPGEDNSHVAIELVMQLLQALPRETQEDPLATIHILTVVAGTLLLGIAEETPDPEESLRELFDYVRQGPRAKLRELMAIASRAAARREHGQTQGN